jgi:hypothetical protein
VTPDGFEGDGVIEREETKAKSKTAKTSRNSLLYAFCFMALTNQLSFKYIFSFMINSPIADSGGIIID